MAFNFDSGQFNRESTPKRLGNWQVPRWAPTRARPVEMRPNPKPICDNNGHFLPGAPKGSSRCFGHYTGTWDLPRKITRKVAEDLAKEPPDGRFPDWLNLRVQRPKAVASLRTRGGKHAKGKDEAEEGLKETPQTFQDSNPFVKNSPITPEENNPKPDELEEIKNQENDEDPLNLNETKLPLDENGHGPYVPGSLTDPENRHESHELLVKDAVEQIHGPQDESEDKFWQLVAENAKKDMKDRKNMKCHENSNNTLKLPYVNVTPNFHFAKKMHVGNLEHQPLPDTLGYRNMTKIGEHRESDIVVKPYAIGWKGYGASGPTCCTKLRVHRPKTCDPKKMIDDDQKQNLRPSTSALDLGGQYKKPLSLMDLAICWDFRPEDPKREPRPAKHIDGSNGSKAPAVFTMVRTPKDEVELPIAHSNPIFNQNSMANDIGHHQVPYFEKDMTKETRKDSCEVQNCSQHKVLSSGKKSRSESTSRKSSSQSAKKSQCDGIHGCGTPDTSQRSNGVKNPDKLQHIKDAWINKPKNNYDINQNRHSLESYDKTALAQGQCHHSSPEGSQTSKRPVKESTSSNAKHKNCLPCNSKKTSQEIKSKEDYKFAFKAGNPNPVQSVTSSTNSKGIKMPKLRNPYTKKSYTIPTLAPPFSIWRDANATGYPEHWRLASVYQHAYKPPELRRKPLIDSVYQ